MDVAAQIQQDLRVLSEPEVAGTGLWEIDAWTGVKVDVCVNFLSLPSTDQNEDEDEECAAPTTTAKEVRIAPVSEWQDTVSRTVQLEERQEWKVPDGLEGREKCSEAYVVSFFYAYTRNRY